ncbi:MAG: enoyl-CoA hydratase/isomerase family protein [Deltaproteobacteria bacterium]|nr:enoyl-CoA hydratase/isomerase family protein [Deltaproteobacteria bacterium]
MTNLIREDHDGVVRLSLASGTGNPLTPELLAELRGAIAELGERPPRALVLDGGAGKLFSGGFDVPTIATYDRPALSAFFGGFLTIVDRLLVLPCPTVVAIHGSAIAGGFILSLAFDLRVVQRGPLKLGLSEVDLGIAVPAGTQVLLAERTSPQAARRLSLTGQYIDAEEAARLGYCDRLVDDARAEALTLARALADKPGDGAAVTRSFLAEELRQRVAAADAAFLEPFLDTWLSPPAQACLRALAARLTR